MLMRIPAIAILALASIGVGLGLGSVALAFGLGVAEGKRPTREEMLAAETQLVFHGYPVEGFAATRAPDLELPSLLAPPGCAKVWRRATLVQLAIARLVPEKKSDAPIIGIAAGIAYADQIGRIDCVAAIVRRPSRLAPAEPPASPEERF